MLRQVHTANSAEHQLSTLVTANAPDISRVRDGQWYLIAPYGEHVSPDGNYTQVFQRAQADRVVKTWNSMSGKAARWFKNLSHGLGGKFSAPIWDGHPDADKGRWPEQLLLGELTDLRASDAGLEGCQTWNAKNVSARTRGPLFPSPLWWHFPKDAQGRVFPELLESIGLVPDPNISSVPAWTQNASPDPASAEVLQQTAHSTQENTMIPIAAKLGLPEDATEAQILTKIGEILGTANAAAENNRTANSARDALQVQLTTANTRATTLETEKGQLTTANAELTGIVADLAGGVVHGFEAAGVIPPCDRESMLGKLTANASAKATVAELKVKKPVLNTQSIQLGADKRDISTANARLQVINDAVAKRIKDHGETYDQAYAACQADPTLKPVFDAMADPSKTKAA